MLYPGDGLKREIKEKIWRFRLWVSNKIWRGKTPDEIMAKRGKLFLLIGFSLIGIFGLYRYFFGGFLLPNFELIIPTIVVMGSVSFYVGASPRWKVFYRYFGVLAIISYLAIVSLMFGFNWINIFVGSGFIFAWLIATRNKISFFDDFKKLVFSTTITAAIAILLFDFWTGIIGTSLTMGVSYWAAFIGQIPFTMYHLASLIFIPPLLGLGKMLVRVRVPVKVGVATRARENIRRRN